VNDTLERVDALHPCRICGAGGDKGCYRLGKLDGCRRVSAGSFKTASDGSWLHRRPGEKDDRPRQRGRVFTVRTHSTSDQMGKLAGYYKSAVPSIALAALAVRLGVSVESLNRLGIGWAYDTINRRANRTGGYDPGDALRSCDNRAWSFPMTDADGRIVGIRIRTDAAKKWSVTGGHDGLFIPEGIDFDSIVVCEGATDCAAMLDLGFNAIGRSCCTGGTRIIVELCRKHRTQSVVIFGDRDLSGGGQRGAESLASTLRPYIPTLRVIYPPEGIKDARAWKNAGATAADVATLIQSVPLRKLAIRSRELAHV